ncbi:ribose-phosphate diphosphokinase [Jannaschia seohaensis]|uniref:ribose-phosphate diphosphokinase n=1 Tax=Jannaschia seohaensis TaxID=475081 RepID=A0A2Y9AMT5_9RHOB|nr:ribose-phosphate diphosphokinase [Jannaschia seohaensis]PWJ20572.1 ribose-phosphate pyrophosphokinase [Jannaschia seohaensis]SSA44668.1 ribose-phosphate pyrophosphokinase [Jannaschia seohaensis]
MLFFALQGSQELGDRVAAAGGYVRAPHEERDFDGGEHKARPLVEIRDRDVFVMHSLEGDGHASANDKLVRLLFFLATCREHGAARVTAIAPYLAYSRKDRQTKPCDPVSTRIVAQLFEAAGVDMVLTLDVHNLMAFQNAFRCRTLHLATDRLFAAHIAGRVRDRPLAIVSPDPGGVKRAQLVREALEEATGGPVGFGLMEKRRSAGVVSGSHFAGDVAERVVFVVDDMICGGGTILRAAEAVRAHGAAEVHAIATHGLLTDAAIASLADSAVLDSIALTDSVAAVAAAKDALGDRLRLVSCVPLIAEAIARLHRPERAPRASPAALLDGRQ